MTDHYEILGVEPDAPREEIRTAYRAKIGELDQTLANPKARNRQALREEKAAVNRAWTVLADPFQRERYDATLDLDSDSTTSEEPAEGAMSDTDPGHKPSFRERMKSNAERTERAGGRSPGPDAAPVMKRLGAAMMDVVVMGAFVVALASAVAATTDEVTGAVTIGVVVAIVLLIGAYNVVPVTRTGQTLGHRLMGLKVVREEDGGLLDRPQAVRRYAIPVVLVGMGDPFIMVALLLGLSFLFSQTRLSLLDRLAKSRVVVASKG